MKADKIIKNAKIYTSDKNKSIVTALAVKDGKFVYVGDEAGLSQYEGEVTDLGGRFVLPGIIDSHVHVTTGVAFEYTDLGVPVMESTKKECLEFMADYIKKNPGLERYRFMMERTCLAGEELTKEDLDAICPDAEILVLEGEVHSNWVNSRILAAHGITDDTPDPVPGLAYYVRKDGHLTGNSYETASWPFLFDGVDKLTDEQITIAVLRWLDSSLKYGVSAVFDAGFPEHNHMNERIYSILRDLDKQGLLPVYVDGCYVLTQPGKTKEALEGVKRFREEFNTEHMKVHTLKIFMDGTLKIETAAMVTPYIDTGALGAPAFKAEELAEIIKELNAEGLDLHVHTVGEASSRVVLDGVELARKALGDKYRVKVTCAHLWVQDDADLNRFASLGVTANFTPWWHSGNVGGNPAEYWPQFIGEKRGHNMFRCKTIWDTGALVTWSSDEVFYGDFKNWSPYLAMEIGMTRWINEKTRFDETSRTVAAFPPLSESMNIEEMIQGYTINGAKQLGIEASKGSIEIGKDADFLVFDKDLLTAEHEGFSFNMPCEVYFGGKSMTPKSVQLLAEGYEIMNGLTVPVGTSNKDLAVEGAEPKNAEKITIECPRGEKINLYVFRPADYVKCEKTPLIYFIHGGGYHFGNTSMDESKIQGVADGSNATVVSPDYTLSLDPSYRYPMELEEVYTGLEYVYRHADELNVDPDNIVIEGESAGGGLTARLALYNRDKGCVPLKGQVLIYPMLDCRTGGRDDIYRNEYAGEFVWTKENNVFGWGKLLEGQEKELSDDEKIYFSPALADVEQLKGLPETFMIVGSLDLFCNEDMDYARKLMQAGVFTELYVEPGVPHAYEYLEWTPQAARFLELRNHATIRMLGTEERSQTPDAGIELGDLLKYISGMGSTE